MTEPDTHPETHQAPRYVRIAHADGREYAVLEPDFATVAIGPAGETYEALGFAITRYDDGQPYGEQPAAEPPAAEPAA